MRLLLLCLISTVSLYGEVYYEGTATFRGYGKVDLSWLVQFLPYNPVIVEAGAFRGAEVLYAAKVWPHYQKIVAFEPNPKAFNQLHRAVTETKLKKVKIHNFALNAYNGLSTLYLCNDPFMEHESSLLPPTKEMEARYQGPKIEVPCVMFDDWCEENDIDHIDILRLDLEGLELQVLQKSQNILKNVKILILPSFFYNYRVDMTYYFNLKDFLTKANFVPLAHWYSAGERGLAVYISQELFDAYFVRCLGLGLGGLLYP